MNIKSKALPQKADEKWMRETFEMAQRDHEQVLAQLVLADDSRCRLRSDEYDPVALLAYLRLADPEKIDRELAVLSELSEFDPVAFDLETYQHLREKIESLQSHWSL